ncbi:Drug/Metabolite Transporter (DMT) Superfamily [Phytophthora palmivora]|uniref:Drug/Metabolite Transporter (DMT) Superfamily n=1 Tax=Phytophthora palmivora TaxID=4796 RepID=A0A2P4YQH2_9STRA|nr:Drug/Metabolite Transporter (DMT) Superfamily [Phytophthora palmivora]
MPFSTPPFIHLGIDARTGKSYHICSRKSLLSFGAILLLLVAMSSERFLFKVMDLVEDDGMEFPKFHFFIMGLLDLLHGLVLFIAGGRTDPTQTLLFMQASIPISACMSAAFFGVSVFYLLAAIPGSLSMLYKERVIRDQPSAMFYLDAWVLVNQ